MNYEITIDGKILNEKGVEKIQQKDKKGYMRVLLYNNSKPKMYLVHRLIAEKYIPNPENKPCINHIDGNPSNNSLDNLEWVTYSENNIHKYRVLKNKPGMGRCKLTDDEIIEIRNKYIPNKYSYRMLAAEYGVSHNAIIQIIKNRRYKKEYYV